MSLSSRRLRAVGVSGLLLLGSGVGVGVSAQGVGVGGSAAAGAGLTAAVTSSGECLWSNAMMAMNANAEPDDRDLRGGHSHLRPASGNSHAFHDRTA